MDGTLAPKPSRRRRWLIAVCGTLVGLVGALAANLIGRSIISAGEVMLGRMPVVRNVYKGTKQIFESVVTASAPTRSSRPSCAARAGSSAATPRSSPTAARCA